METANIGLGYNDIRLEKKEAFIVNGFISSGSCSTHSTFTNYNEQKSCYRFLSNPKVTERILIEKMKNKCSKSVAGKRVIAALDTTTITMDTYLGRITDFEGLGMVGRNQQYTSFGFFMHPIYVIDEVDSTPYGLADVHLMNRPMEVNPLSKEERKRLKNKRLIEEKESYKWVGPCLNAKQKVLAEAENVTFVMDREGDIWEVFERIPGEKTDLVVRSKQNRRILNARGEQTKLHTQLGNQKAIGRYEIDLPRKKSRARIKAIVEVKIGSCQIIPSQFNRSEIPISLSYVEIKEIEQTGVKLEDPVHWILWTNRKLETTDQAKEIVLIYAKRWGIEVFFKLLKSDGYNIEKNQLETGRAIRRLTLIIMEATIRVLQLKAARAGETKLQVKEVFENEEIECLKLLNKKLNGRTKKQKNPYPENHLSWASWIIARLAGWKEFYSKNNPPGNKTFVKGLQKFDALMIGYSLAK